MKKNKNSVSKVDNIKLSKKEENEILNDVQELHDAFEKYWNYYYAPVICIVGSSDEDKMNKYRKFILKRFPKIYRDDFEIVQTFSPDSKDFALTVNITYSPDDEAELIEHAKFLCKAAKVHGCQFGGIALDAIADDDLRVQHL